VEGRAGGLGSGHFSDRDGDVAAAVGVRQQLGPALGVVRSCDSFARVWIDDRDLGADPVGMRASDRQLVAVGDEFCDRRSTQSLLFASSWNVVKRTRIMAVIPSSVPSPVAGVAVLLCDQRVEERRR